MNIYNENENGQWITEKQQVDKWPWHKHIFTKY